MHPAVFPLPASGRWAPLAVVIRVARLTGRERDTAPGSAGSFPFLGCSKFVSYLMSLRRLDR
jgi:hypothetical protein